MEVIKDPRAEILHTKCETLKEFDLNTVTFMGQLHKLMFKEKGIGLSAPQVGVPLQAFVMLRQNGHLLKVINPKILEKGKIVTSKQEGCLSVPGKRYNVKRSKRIKVEFRNEIGEFIKMELKNFDAFVFQHELDHLRGILISD